MHWAILAAAVVVAVACYQLGTMAVWIAVLTISLRAVLVAIAVVALILGLALAMIFRAEVFPPARGWHSADDVGCIWPCLHMPLRP